MGKLAENEGIKLRATFFNNLAVGLWVAGFLVPYFTLAYRTEDFFKWLAGTGPTTVTTGFVWATIDALSLALIGGIVFRIAAMQTIKKLKD